MNEEKKMLPVGFDDFKDIISRGYYYVDKTAMITALLKQTAYVSLFTRPRRFGKSLNMSMLRYFFEIDTDKSLFDGLAISKEQELCQQHMGQYPVICISLKDVEGLDYQGALESLKSVVKAEAERLHFLMDSSRLDQVNKQKFFSLRTGKADVGEALRVLSQLLYLHYDKKVVILIDEYDVPLAKAAQHGYYDEMVILIRQMFGSALKTNDCLQFAVLTGCLRISKESIFTGLNNFRVYSITDARFDEWFGFSEAEVNELLHYYGLEEYHNEIKEWYDGYRFGEQEVYCPWDVLNYCDDLVDSGKSRNARPKLYWLNASENAEVRTLIDHVDTRIAQNEIENLIAGKTVRKKINEQLTHDEIYSSIGNLWSLLFMTGYLTMTGSTDGEIYELVIPNKEVREIYEKQVLAWFESKSGYESRDRATFFLAFETGDTDCIEDGINEAMLNSISYYDEYETFYHGFLLALLSSCENWQAISNRETGKGRSDIFVERKDRTLGFVVEFKYVKDESKLETAAQKALEQIEEMQYAAPLIQNKTPRIRSYGIAFCKKQCKVKTALVK